VKELWILGWLKEDPTAAHQLAYVLLYGDHSSTQSSGWQRKAHEGEGYRGPGYAGFNNPVENLTAAKEEES
jgi:hypothetical protein